MISLRLISYLVPAFLLAGLGFMVYRNDRRNVRNQVFAAMTLAIILWIVSLAFADTTHSLVMADIASRWAFVTGTLSMLCVLLTAVVLSGHRLRRWWPWTAVSLVFIGCAPFRVSVDRVTLEPYGTGVQGGPVYLLFSLFAVAALVTAVVVLARAAWRAYGEQRRQLQYLAIGLTASTLIALVTNLVFVDLANVGPAAFLIFVALTAYAMIRHHLLDMRFVVARSVAYILLLATLTLLYTLALYLLFNVFFITARLTVLQNVLFVGFSILIAFTLPPLRRFFERATDRIFFRDQYDPQRLLDRVTHIFANELKLVPLLDKFLKELTQDMRLTNAQLIVLDDGHVYGQAAHGRLPHGRLTGDSLFLLRHPFMVVEQLAAGDLRQSLTELDIQVVMQLRAHGELVGYLVLGDKQAGTPYANQDLAVLEIMRNELAVAIANAKAYDEIATFNVTLQERIRDATKRLKAANRNLRALDKTKDEFISMASHQLGTPLTAITGYLVMALDSDKHNMTKDQREFVSYALEAAEKMVYMAGDMLNVSRLNSGRFMIQRQPTELAGIVEQEVHQLQPAAQRKGLSLTLELPGHPVPANLDESKTRQVIMNFIDNALYYTQKGGVHVKLSTGPGNEATLTVTDTGIGVPEAEKPKLFAKFYRADNAKSVRPDGTGLGLYLAKRVIEDQGGRLIFASEEGKGSTFGFTLPT